MPLRPHRRPGMRVDDRPAGISQGVTVADILIRDVPDEVVAAIDEEVGFSARSAADHRALRSEPPRSRCPGTHGKTVAGR